MNIFGTLKKEKLNLFNPPYSVRNNCQIGRWCLGEDDIVGESLEIAIIAVKNFHGDLGKTKDTNWKQVWFIGSPKEEKLPKNLICVTYIKTRSISQMGIEIQKHMTEEIDPGLGLFNIGFQKHNGELGIYYSLDFKWRQRNQDELKQLNLMEDFLNSNQPLIDETLPPTMTEGLKQATIDIEAKAVEKQLQSVNHK
jgi:hypothetical protein